MVREGFLNCGKHETVGVFGESRVAGDNGIKLMSVGSTIFTKHTRGTKGVQEGGPEGTEATEETEGMDGIGDLRSQISKAGATG